jgi:hypothetical protein
VSKRREDVLALVIGILAKGEPEISLIAGEIWREVMVVNVMNRRKKRTIDGRSG